VIYSNSTKKGTALVPNLCGKIGGGKPRIFPQTLAHTHDMEFGMDIADQLLAEHEAWRERVRRRPAPPRRRRDMPRCGAYARSTGQPCKAKALANGRCKNHGGLSTGPKTTEGKARALANLKQFRNLQDH
jgi:hypothetical protein